MKNIIWICITLYSFIIIACGPSKEDIKSMKSRDAKLRTVTVQLDTCGCKKQTLQYYNVGDCEFIGQLDNSSHDFISHSAQCEHCEKRHIFLMDSLIKENLKVFFTTKSQ